MKKSEMLALLKQDIKDAEGDLDLQAGMVLARVLSCGMLPPPDAIDSVTDNIAYAYYNERVEADPNTEEKYYNPPIISKLWEPENED